MARGIWLVCCLLLLCSGCVPLTHLRGPQVAQGREIVLGGTVLFVSNASGPGILPYGAVAFGDGQVEVNVSTQFGLRAGLKAALETGAALDFGLSFPLLPTDLGFPLGIDAGFIWGMDDFYIAPRLVWLGFQSNTTLFPSSSGFGYQAHLGYGGDLFIGELGLMGSFATGELLFIISGGVRF